MQYKNFRKKRFGRKKRIIFVLSCIVTFLTVYSLVLPAITIDKETADEDNGIVLNDNRFIDTKQQGEEADNTAETISSLQNKTEETKEISTSINEEAEYPSVIFSDSINDTLVHISAPEGAFPKGTVMTLKEVENEEVSASVGEVINNNEIISYKAIDITFVYNGEKIEPRIPIEVSMTSNFISEEPKDPLLVHIDDEGKADVLKAKKPEEDLVETISENSVVKELIENNNDIDEITIDNTLTFESDSFSLYVLVYTVDFTYEGRTWSFPGQGSYRLADVLAVLGIEGSIDDASLTLILGEDHAGALYLTQADGEYYINSDIAFTDTYELRVRSAERVYLISVTDNQTSADLSNFLKNAVITGATQDPDGSYHVESGEEYSIILTFAESSNYQFDNTGTLSYQIPEGIEILTRQESDGNINIVYKGRTYQVGFHYVLETDGSLKIEFDQSDPDFPRLEESTNVSFRFTYTGEFDGSKTKIIFNDVIERDITFDEPEPGQAFASKSGVFDETTGKFNYTITVTATGDVTNVNVKDVISGNALIFNNDVRVSGNSSSYRDNGAANGFDYTFASMQDGEEITITYSANVNFNMDTDKDGKISVDQTKNTVTVDPDPGEPHNSEYSHEIAFKTTKKSNGTPDGTTADGDKIYKWTITYNELRLASAGGDTIKDKIAADSTEYMKYYGAGLNINVIDKNGNIVDTRSVPYSSLQSYSDSSWTYKIPEGDSQPYMYEITYYTVVDMEKVEGTGNTVTVNNDANGSSGSAGVTPESVISVDKSVESFTTEEVNWTVTLGVPENGLTQAVVTDTFPAIWLNGRNIYDLLKDGSLKITGLVDGESYTVENVGQGQVKITFFQDPGKRITGLKATPGGHTITIKLTTEVDQEWLQAGYETGGYVQTHTNTVDFNGKQAQASVIFGKPGIEKKGDALKDSEGNVTGLKYTVVLKGISETPVSVLDTFDTSILEVDTSKVSSWDHMRIWGGNQWSQDAGRMPVSYTDTSNGIILTADSVPMQADGSYYPYYRIVYYLKLKEGVDLQQLAIANGGTYDLDNTAFWNGHESKFTYTTKYDFLNKELLNAGELGGTNRKAQYKITFNPAKATLHDGEPMVMTDVMSANLSVDYGSIQIVTDPPGQTVPYSLSGGKDEEGNPDGTTIATYTVPDSTKVVITYDADVRGNGGQTIVNKVSVNGEEETVTTTKSYGTVSEGQGAIASFKIVKVDGYDANKKLEGVQFKIFAVNPEIDFGEKVDHAKVLTLTTDENGEIMLDGEEYDFYFNEVYHIQEVEPLDDYGTIGFDYLVTLTNDMERVDYDHYVYYYSDSMQIKNWPLEGLVIEKQVESPDNADKERYYTFRVSILNDDGTVNTDYNDKNGDDTFVNGAVEFELKDKEQKMFWGFKKGTKYKVEEIDSKGLATSVTYSVFDADGNVTETITVNDTEHTGTLTQQNEVILFKNSRTEKGALKLKKLVTVNDQATTGTAADGDYTFTITGPGTSGTVSKTVVITVTNGVAASATVDGQAVDLVDGFVVISDLEPGDYTITETNSTNTNVTLASITGGKSGTANVQNKQVTVTVTADETIAAEATATFTNNIDLGSLEITKNIQRNGTADTTATGTFYYAVYNEQYNPDANPAQIPVARGSIEVTENGSNIATVSDLPYGTYYVYELTGQGGTPIVSGDNGVQKVINDTIYTVTGSGTSATISSSASTGSVTLTNNIETTDVSVEKQWKPAVPENTTITLGLYSGKTVADAAAATTPVTTIELDGTADNAAVNISNTDPKAGTKQETSAWNAEFKNLPKYAYDTDGVYEIKYVVKEIQAPEGYTVSYGGEWAGSDYVISGGTITNTKNPGDLELTKKVAGDGADTSKEFEFTIELTAPSGETLAESYTFKKGDAEATGITYTRNGTATETAIANSTATVTGIKLKADETFTIVGLPAGTTYKITETDYSAAGYSSNIPADGKTGTIRGGTTAKESVEVTNTLSAGSLTVEKTLVGNATNADKEFNFKVTFEKAGLTGNNGTYKIGTLETIASVDATNITFTEGKAEISYKLKGGQKAVFSNLPDGTKFTVEEISKDADGYETTVSSTGGTVNADKTVTGSISSTAAVTVSYVNTKDTIPVEAAKAWKSGDTAIAWPEDVESVEFTLYKTVNSQTTVVDADDLKNYWVDTSTFTNPITISSSTEGKKASWADLPKRMLVTTETADGQEVTTSAWYDVTYSVKETKVTFTAASGKETLETEEAIQAAYNPTSWDATDKTITNNVPKITIEGTKTWNVLGSSIPTVNPTLTLTRISSKEGADPETVTPAEGQPVWSDVEGQTNVKKYQFTELDKYDTDGYLYTYSVTEASFKVGDVTYTVTKNGDTYTVKVGETEVKTFTVTQEGYNITNTETKDFEFTKIWRDISQQDVKWPEGKQITVTFNASVEGEEKALEDQKLTFSPDTCPEGWTKEISADGNKTTFKISGLAAKDADGKELTYYVVEETVEGYNEPIYAFDMNGTITIKPDSDRTKDKAVNRDYIINTPEGGYELPQTGGPGTRLFTILGSILILGAGVLLWRRRRLI